MVRNVLHISIFSPNDYCAFTRVHPLGMPLVPLLQLVLLGVVNVPAAATPLSQPLVQYAAEMSVARHLTLLKLEQYSNILL